FDEELDSIEKLGWLMNHSKLFKNTVLGFASRFLLNNEGIIKKSIEKSRKAQKEGPLTEK
ncbi:MAG: hypothetical protein GY950_36925, partial [bacterium]|nr:hypothetical protein [bacterium]